MISSAVQGLKLAKTMSSINVIVHYVPDGFECSLCGLLCRVLQRCPSPEERLCLHCLRELNNREPVSRETRNEE